MHTAAPETESPLDHFTALACIGFALGVIVLGALAIYAIVDAIAFHIRCRRIMRKGD